MVWNDKAYDHLVYDEQQKDLVLSFVESHGHAKPKLEDVIVGKGKIGDHTCLSTFTNTSQQVRASSSSSAARQAQARR